MLEAAQQQLDGVDDLNEDDRAEAQGLLDKLKSAAGDVATGALGSGDGAIIGAILAHVLGLRA